MLKEEGPYRGADRLKIAVFSLDPSVMACWQLRIQAPFDFLSGQVDARRGVIQIKGKTCFGFPDVLEWADLFLVQRLFPNEETWPLLERLISRQKPLIYETDDLLISIPRGNPNRSSSVHARPWVLKLIQEASALVVSTQEMKRTLSTYHPFIHVLPNLLDDRLWFLSPGVEEMPDPLVIGFAGTPTHLADLDFVSQALLRLQEKHGSRIRFLFMGCATDQNKVLPAFSFIPFQYSYAAYSVGLQEAGIHIGLAPLEDNFFNRCKSNIKWLEYSASHIAGVYSDLPPYREHIRDGETGLLVKNTPEAWFEALDRLVTEPELRRGMARRAREEVVEHFSLSRQGHVFLDTYAALARSGVRPQAPATEALPEALLFEARWDHPDWITVLLSYIHAFSPGERVALLLPVRKDGEGPSLEDVQGDILTLVKDTGRSQFADVMLLDGPAELEECLRGFCRVQQIEIRSGFLAPLMGLTGERMADSYLQMKQPSATTVEQVQSTNQ